jgi:hypothetical protein
LDIERVVAMGLNCSYFIYAPTRDGELHPNRMRLFISSAKIDDLCCGKFAMRFSPEEKMQAYWETKIGNWSQRLW